ncbi:hypothetical protein GCM10027265_30290 [Jatrophihabitans fulvus]
MVTVRVCGGTTVTVLFCGGATVVVAGGADVLAANGELAADVRPPAWGADFPSPEVTMTAATINPATTMTAAAMDQVAGCRFQSVRAGDPAGDAAAAAQVAS